MRLTIEKACSILGLGDSLPSLIELKSAYRRKMLQWHPDVCSNPKAVEKSIAINAAYDFLASVLTVAEKAHDSDQWKSYCQQRMVEWEKLFKKRWKDAYIKSLSDPVVAARGLHFNSCIEFFRRSYIEPKPEWFYGTIFGSKGTEFQQDYRNHLLVIAPNQKMREAYAYKYWKLEFNAPWTFYLPAGKELIAGCK